MITTKENENNIDKKVEVNTYIDRLKYLLNSKQTKILFQEERKVDETRDIRFTNKYTISDLFPNENPVDVLKRELRTLTIENYIETVKDNRYRERSDMRVFGKHYNGRDVYIKIRIELLKSDSFEFGDLVFVMSFHYSTVDFKSVIFPYGK